MIELARAAKDRASQQDERPPTHRDLLADILSPEHTPAPPAHPPREKDKPRRVETNEGMSARDHTMNAQHHEQSDKSASEIFWKCAVSTHSPNGGLRGFLETHFPSAMEHIYKNPDIASRLGWGAVGGMAGDVIGGPGLGAAARGLATPEVGAAVRKGVGAVGGMAADAAKGVGGKIMDKVFPKERYFPATGNLNPSLSEHLTDAQRAKIPGPHLPELPHPEGPMAQHTMGNSLNNLMGPIGMPFLPKGVPDNMITNFLFAKKPVPGQQAAPEMFPGGLSGLHEQIGQRGPGVLPLLGMAGEGVGVAQQAGRILQGTERFRPL